MTTCNKIGIRFIQISYGSHTMWYRDLPGFQEKLRKLHMHDDEEFWAWGSYFKSEGDYYAHLRYSFLGLTENLLAKGVEIDAVVLADPCFSARDEFCSYVENELFINSYIIQNQQIHVSENMDCVNIIRSVDIAKSLIKDGCENVLVLASEKCRKDQSHFRKYSLFSDSSLALVLSSKGECLSYEIVDVAIEEDPDPLEDTGAILTRDLDRICVEKILKNNRMSTTDVSKLFYINLYKPMVEMKVRALGFDDNAIYTDNIHLHGHCFGIDPFISMNSYFATETDPSPFMICASGRQHVGTLILRKM